MHNILDALEHFGSVLAIKLYRLSLDGQPASVPTLPCLDHEARLHETIDPHLSVYLQEASSGELQAQTASPVYVSPLMEGLRSLSPTPNV